MLNCGRSRGEGRDEERYGEGCPSSVCDILMSTHKSHFPLQTCLVARKWVMEGVLQPPFSLSLSPLSPCLHPPIHPPVIPYNHPSPPTLRHDPSPTQKRRPSLPFLSVVKAPEVLVEVRVSTVTILSCSVSGSCNYAHAFSSDSKGHWCSVVQNELVSGVSVHC